MYNSESSSKSGGHCSGPCSRFPGCARRRPVPNRLFGVADQVADAGFEVGQADVDVDAGQQHAVELLAIAGHRPDDLRERIERTGDAVELSAGTGQQRLIEADFVVRRSSLAATCRVGLLLRS